MLDDELQEEIKKEMPSRSSFLYSISSVAQIGLARVKRSALENAKLVFYRLILIGNLYWVVTGMPLLIAG